MEDPKASLYEETTKDSMSSNLVIINTDQTSWQMRCLVPNCYGNDESVVQYFFTYAPPFAQSPYEPYVFVANRPVDLGYFKIGLNARTGAPPFASITFPTATLYDRDRAVRYTTDTSACDNNGVRNLDDPRC